MKVPDDAVSLGTITIHRWLEPDGGTSVTYHADNDLDTVTVLGILEMTKLIVSSDFFTPRDDGDFT